MTKKELFEKMKSSMGNFPPFYPEYRSTYGINCYAYALNINYPDKKYKHYTPGIITALANESDIFEDDEIDEIVESVYQSYFNYIEYHFSQMEIDQITKLLQRDCQKLGLKAIPCDFHKKTGNHSYKIILCTSKQKYGWHFIRESTTWEGEKTWTHKPGWILPVSEIDIPENYHNVIIDGIIFDIKECYEIFF